MQHAAFEVWLLDFRATVCGPPELLAMLRPLRPRGPAWATLPDAPLATTFELRPDKSRAGWTQLLQDGLPLATSRQLSGIFSHLDRALNAAAVAHLQSRYVLLHAGVVALGDTGLVLPGPSGSGKTTLVAGLVAAGCQYLSDEVAVLEPCSGRLLPFPKSLCIKSGARRVLSSMYPDIAALPRGWIDGHAVHYLPPPAKAWPAGPVAVGAVIAPGYLPGSQTSLRPFARTAALELLLNQSAGLENHGAAGVRVLVDVLQEASCYTLTTGNLQDAVELVLARARQAVASERAEL